jgi:4-oxalocrotonate tautomerase
MPLLQVSILEGRTPDQKEELIKRLTETVTETLLVKAESVRITIQEMPKTHWGIAGQSVAKRDGGK